MLLTSLLPACAIILLNLSTFTTAQNCLTDQNPYCAGDNIFEQICCTYPDVCYWANRDGQPACCPYGHVCDGFAPYTTRTTYIPPPLTTTTVRPTTVTTTIPPKTITSYAGGGGVVVTVTSQNPVVVVTTNNPCQKNACATVTSAIVSVYSTITQGAGGVVSTITQGAGQAYSTVNGVLVGDAGMSSRITASGIIWALLAPAFVLSFIMLWHGAR